MVRWLARAGTCLGAEFFGHFALLTCRRGRGIVSQPPTPTVRLSAGDAYQRAKSLIIAGASLALVPSFSAGVKASAWRAFRRKPTMRRGMAPAKSDRLGCRCQGS